MIRVLMGIALAVQCVALTVAEAFAAPAITYADLSTTGGTTLAGPGETVRFYVEGGGCRIPTLDSPPTINGAVIEFSLVFFNSCFATPPPFLWTSDLSAIPLGTYTVNYYTQSSDGTPPTTGPKVLVSSRTLTVGPRPVSPPDLKPGAPDPSFGNSGTVDIPFPHLFSAPLRLAMQQNGQVLISSEVYPKSYAISRLLDSGAVDGAFAVGGTFWMVGARAMAVGVNDEILLAGGVYSEDSSQILLAIQRYSAQGILMNEIDLTSAMLSSAAPIGINPKALDIVSFPDGRFAVAGLAGNLSLLAVCPGQWFVAKFTAGGTLDPTFGQNGVYVGPAAGCVFRLVATHDGGLLALGTSSDTVDANFLVKLNAAGQPDSTFGQGGIVTGTFARTAPRLQEDNKIVLGGANFSLLRLQSNGAPDSTFGNQGVITNQTGMPLQLEDFLLTPNILLVGALVVGHGAPGDPTVLITQPVLVRYSGDGTLDTTFGSGGTSMIGNLSHSPLSGPTGPAEMMTLMALPGGKALLAAPSASGGWSNRSMFVFRFETDPVASYEGLWWNAPPGSESGWGINLAHQGDIIFTTWFTYDLTGNGWWLTMTALKTADGIYRGDLYQTSGPAFDAVPFDPAKVTRSVVGSGTLTFSDANSGTFAYTVNGTSQTKAITREVFAPLPNCTFGIETNLALASNYQDIWWAAPAGAESGWGINFTHQGDTIFATWFTYDHDHAPMWLSVTAPKTVPNTYSGSLYRTTGPAFNAVPFNPAGVQRTIVGSATFMFADGNSATFSYTANDIAQTKAITRQVFQSPGTVCQ